ncbi:ABC transporter permease [Oceanicella sp. SM1341]|uniref:ABC transporter permease n=1 Tax=Oceanicella sp. SM1341 TaxID=1548889 RepID=UPI000E4C3464|nr:ABC transporter permease [Oceanicella sp. SM1341]
MPAPLNAATVGPAPRARGWRTGGWVLIALLPLFLCAAYLVPFLGVANWSITLPEPGLGQYARVATDPGVHSVIWRTLRICALVTLLAVILAYLLTYVWIHGNRPMRILAEICIIVPFWISVLSRAFGWLVVLYNRGILNTWAQDLGILSEPLTLVRNDVGVVIGMVHFLVPFAVFPIASVMRGLDTRVLMAARGMGAGRLRTFWEVFVPMTMPGIFGSAVIVFVFSLGFFVTPALLGGGRSIMIAEYVYVQIFQASNWGLAAALSVTMIVIVSLLLLALMRLTRVEKLVR